MSPDDGSASAGNAPIRVLVVEDDPLNQQVARRQMSSAGFDPVVVPRGEQALVLLEKDGVTFDVVLMDINLGGIDGYETVRRLRRSSSPNATIPVVALTAGLLPSDRQRCLDVGMNDVLAKPAGRKMLVQTLQHLLGRDHGDRDLEVAPTSLPSADPPSVVFDPAALERMQRDLGELGPVRAFVMTFLDELAPRTERAAVAIESGDVETAAMVLHTLRSVSSVSGAVRLSAWCRRAEETVESLGLADVDRLRRHGDDAATSLRAWLAQAAAISREGPPEAVA